MELSKFTPRRVRVKAVQSGRYPPGHKPTSWDDRKEGIEVVETETGETLELYSRGGQSTPGVGWELLLTGVEGQGVYLWTLYGLQPSATAHSAF